ncbi:MAG: major capsid protein [Sulfolobales archaeon]
MREILEQLNASLIEVVSKIEIKGHLLNYFADQIIPETFVKAGDVARAFSTLKVTQSDHPAEVKVETLNFAVYPLADLRFKSVITADELRSWEKVLGDLPTVLASKIQRGIAYISLTQDKLISQAFTGSISHPAYPSGMFHIVFGTPTTIDWTAADSTISKILEGLNILQSRGYGGKIRLFVGRTIFDRILADEEVKTLINAQSIASAFLTGQTNLVIMGVEIVPAFVMVDGAPLVDDNSAYLVAENSIINVYGLPNVINAQPVKYQPLLIYNEHDLQGVEILVACRYLPVAFTDGIIRFNAV